MMKTFNFGGCDGFILENEKMKVSLISYGARLVELCYEGLDVTLGFDTLEDYKESTIYCGATVGRYANRIANGSFMLGGRKISVSINENDKTTLHGGVQGFDSFVWESEVLSENSVCFTRESSDGEMGFPGNLKISVTYTLIDTALMLEYRAVCDQDTPFSPTNHAYFNLDGHKGEDCRRMLLRLDAPYYLPVDADLIPSGEIAPVEGTAFDFRKLRPIAQDYDHCFVIAKDRQYRNVGTLVSERSGIRMDIETDLPAVQLYTCSMCNEKAGKEGIPLHIHHAVALETQFYPDSPNHDNFPSTLLPAGQPFYSATKYIFSKE